MIIVDIYTENPGTTFANDQTIYEILESFFEAKTDSQSNYSKHTF